MDAGSCADTEVRSQGDHAQRLCRCPNNCPNNCQSLALGAALRNCIMGLGQRSHHMITKQYGSPDVLFREALHPAQFASVNTSWTARVACHGYSAAALGLPKNIETQRLQLLHVSYGWCRHPATKFFHCVLYVASVLGDIVRTRGSGSEQAHQVCRKGLLVWLLSGGGPTCRGCRWARRNGPPPRGP